MHRLAVGKAEHQRGAYVCAVYGYQDTRRVLIGSIDDGQTWQVLRSAAANWGDKYATIKDALAALEAEYDAEVKLSTVASPHAPGHRSRGRRRL